MTNAAGDQEFTHLDPHGRARMVDVTPKEPTHRRAVARCKVFMQPETTAAIAHREVKKGDVLSVARVAGIQAAKRTSDMIPLCHPLLVGAVSVNFEIGDDYVAIEAHVDTVERTGVEMEALPRLQYRSTHGLRHVQVRRPGHGDRRTHPVGEDGRPIRDVSAPRRRRDGDALNAGCSGSSVSGDSTGPGPARYGSPVVVTMITRVVARFVTNVVESSHCRRGVVSSAPVTPGISTTS